MANPNKNQGTKNETRRKRVHRAAGFLSGRVAEGGSQDDGDVWIIAHPEADPEGVGWIDEAKACANLNPHKTLDKAIRKSGHLRTVLSHKRLVRKDGAKRRGPDGLVEVVSAHPITYEVLLRAYEELRARDPEFVANLWKDQ